METSKVSQNVSFVCLTINWTVLSVISLIFINGIYHKHWTKEAGFNRAYVLSSHLDAVDVLKGMLQGDQVPSQMAITRIVQTMGSHGNVQGIQEVENLVKTLGPSINLSTMLFVNNTALAQIKKWATFLCSQSHCVGWWWLMCHWLAGADNVGL